MTSSAPAVPVSRKSAVALLALWTLAGCACVIAFLGMFTIGVFVAPFAMALMVVAILLTVRRPGRWPAAAGLGFALALGLVWLGVVLGHTGPQSASGSCSATTDGVQTCESGGRTWVPGAFDEAAALPWFVAAGIVAMLTVVAYAVARRVAASTVSRAAGVGT